MAHSDKAMEIDDNGMSGFFKYVPSSKFDWKIFLLISAVALVCCLLCRNGLAELFGGMHTGADSNVFFTVARMMFEKGAVPYRDAFDHKGPLIYFINYAALYSGGFYMIFFLEFINIWLSLFFFWLSIRKFASPCVRFSSLLFFVYLIAYCMAGGNMTEEFALPHICFAFYALTMFFENRHAMFLYAFWGGFSTTWILLLKFNCAAVHFVLAGLAVLWYLRGRRFIDCFKFILCLLAGSVVIAAPVLAYLYSKQVLQYCYKDYIIFNLEYAGGQNVLLTLLRVGERLFGIPFFTIVFIVFGLYVVFWKQISRKRRYLISVLFLIFLANAAVVFPGNFYFEHYFFPLVPLISMLLVLGDVLVEEQLVRISILPTTALSPALVSVRTSDDKVFTLVIAKTDTCATPGMEDSGRHTPVVYGFTPPLAPIMRIFCQSILLIFMSIYLLHTMIGQCRILLNQVEYSRKFKPDPIIAEHVRDNNRGILVYAGGAATGAATGYWYRRYNALPTVRYFYRPPVNFKKARKREFLSCFTPKKSPLILVIRNTRVQAEVRSLLNTHYSPIKTRDGTLYVPKTANTESKLR